MEAQQAGDACCVPMACLICAPAELACRLHSRPALRTLNAGRHLCVQLSTQHVSETNAVDMAQCMRHLAENTFCVASPSRPSQHAEHLLAESWLTGERHAWLTTQDLFVQGTHNACCHALGLVNTRGPCACWSPTSRQKFHHKPHGPACLGIGGGR